MPPYKRKGDRTDLNTISASPLAIAKGYASAALSRWREANELAQRIAATVKSVDIVSDQVHFNFAPEKIEPRAMVRVPMGPQDLALRGGLDVEKTDQEVLLTLKLDAYILDHALGRHFGGLMSQAACRFNTKIRVTLHDTIDGEVATAPVPAGKRLGKKAG